MKVDKGRFIRRCLWGGFTDLTGGSRQGHPSRVKQEGFTELVPARSWDCVHTWSKTEPLGGAVSGGFRGTQIRRSDDVLARSFLCEGGVGGKEG